MVNNEGKCNCSPNTSREKMMLDGIGVSGDHLVFIGFFLQYYLCCFWIFSSEKQRRVLDKMVNKAHPYMDAFKNRKKKWK